MARGRSIVFIIICLVSAAALVSPSAARAQSGAKCCVAGPGDCYQKLDYDEIPSCAGGYSIRHQSCDSVDTCKQSPTQQIRCCMCPNSMGDISKGSCIDIKPPDNSCGNLTNPCSMSSKFCYEEELCQQWHAAAQGPTEKAPRLTFFIPSVTIPGSGLFNKGQPVVLRGETLGEYIAALFIFFVGVAGILATVMMMYGGLKYIVSFGSAQKVSDAKDTIVSAMLGLLIALASYTILLTINPNLVKFSGLKLQAIHPIPQEEVATGTERQAIGWRGNNTTEFDKCLTDEAVARGVDRNWLKALMLVESSGNPAAQSPAGACGLIQLMPATADKYQKGVTCAQLLNPATNISIAAQYYKNLLVNPCPKTALYKSGKTADCSQPSTCTQRKPDDVTYANAGYNGGQGANCYSVSCPGKTWWECEINTGYAETRNYVQKVADAHQKIINSNPPNPVGEFVWHDTDAGALTCAQLRVQYAGVSSLLAGYPW